MKTAGYVILCAVCGMMASCQGRTTENVEPTGDTVEVRVATPEEKADTVLHSMDDEMLHALDNETVLNTKI